MIQQGSLGYSVIIARVPGVEQGWS
jgi:hypothetical protein